MGEEIIIFRHVYYYLLNELGRKVGIISEESNMKSFNSADIYQNKLYVKNHCSTFIK